MKTLSKYLIIILVVVGFAKLLPTLYSMAFSKFTNYMSVEYSAVIHDFVYEKSDIKFNSTYHDFVGNEYTEREYKRLLPFSNYYVLETRGELPETVNGEYVNSFIIRAARDFARFTPINIDATNTRIKLHPLFESASDTGLELPKEFFRMSNRMEFINTITNSVDEEKSVLFTTALENKGFTFPAKLVIGNESTMKPYDFGYFILDANDKIFHVYQADGTPIIADTKIQIDDKIIYMSVRENAQQYYGFIVTEGGEVYRISKQDYRADKIYVENYDPKDDILMYSSDLQNIVMTLTKGLERTLFVSDIELEPIDKHGYLINPRISGLNKTVYDAIFPFIIQPNYDIQSRLPIISWNFEGTYAIVFSVVLAAVYVAFRRRRTDIGEAILVVVAGVYAFIPVMLLSMFKK